ncbi:hypothetical protein D9619_009399 [Psilocybe cf. subviscida]|uniref:Uncharacterized protein n=1 Tax=Psilocybe cf. subviscida TaxID=2480587 RepID=A0A8H5FAJ6_9AGAR|nr:hypothetical protein D9619_009399 [Psilocybe cf. subviscida]
MKDGGKCDEDKKAPLLQQSADWSHHKRFCRSGIESSGLPPKTKWQRHSYIVNIDPDGPDGSVSTRSSGAPAIQMAFPGGVTIASSTMTPEFMKEVRDHVKTLNRIGIRITYAHYDVVMSSLEEGERNDNDDEGEEEVLEADSDEGT